MKTIIGALLLGLVACAFGAAAVPKMPEGCIDVHNKAVSDFNFNKFFSGQWHMTHAKLRVTNEKTCETFSVNGDKVTFTLNGQSVSCKLEKVAGARFTKFNCQMGQAKFTSYVSVLATDYDNYVLVYRCGSHEGANKDNYLIGQRTKSTTFPAGLTSSLGSKGLQKSDFSSYNCP
uniref:Putative lipocalin n=1 Tax=Rhodnius prolixus TaxID=13249 RepID=R4FN70_RHOPR